MAKSKKKSAVKNSRNNTAAKNVSYGLEYDFILIAGGGFVALVLVILFLTR